MRSMAFIGLCLLGCASVPAATGDENWSWKFFPNGPDDEVTAITASGQNVYVGGTFTTFGPYAFRSIVQWSGSGWVSLGGGLLGKVYGIAVDARGYVYAAGELSSGVNGTANYAMAVWDGQAWSFPPQAMGKKSSGPIAAIGNEAFLVLSGQAELYRWTGSDLVSLKSAPNGSIQCLKAVGMDLYVGGTFSNIGGVASNHAAKWSDGKWASLDGGTDVSARAMAVLNGELLVAGSVAHVGASESPGLTRWNGQKWTPFTSLPGNSGYIMSMDAGGGLVYAGGYMDGGQKVFSRWDGTQWIRLGEDLLTYDIQAIGVVGGMAWVGGRFADWKNPIAQYLAVWDGKAWSNGLQLESAIPSGRCDRLASQGGKLYGMGRFATASVDSFSALAQWNGHGWKTVGPKMPWNVAADAIQFESMAVDAQGVVIAGRFLDGQAMELNGIRRWEGGQWIALGRGIPAGQHVFAMQSTPAGLYVGGNFALVGDTVASNLAFWNGAKWSPVGKGTNKSVFALEWDNATQSLYVGGYFDSADGKPCPHLARLQNGALVPVGNPTADNLGGGDVRVLKMRGTDLLVGGTFKTLGAKAVGGTVLWTGSEWKPMGSGVGGEANTFTVTGKDVFVGGRFASNGTGTTVNSFARWSGTEWEPVGKGLTGIQDYPGDVMDIEAFGEDVFVTGTFTFAGGKPSSYFAEWTAEPQPGAVRERARKNAGSESQRYRLVAGKIRVKGNAEGTASELRDLAGRRLGPGKERVRE